MGELERKRNEIIERWDVGNRGLIPLLTDILKFFLPEVSPSIIKENISTFNPPIR